MRGLDALIAMRKQRMKPSVVFIDTDAGPEALPKWAQWQNAGKPHLCNLDIQPSESLRRIDWRPLIGLTVHVSGSDADRVKVISQAVFEAGAKRVISSCLQQIGEGEFVAFKTLWVNDTDGHFNQGDN